MAFLSFAQEPSLPWDGSAMAPQDGKLAVVTGANSGIGFFTARALAANGAHVILACRSEKRGCTAQEEITQFLQEHAPMGKGSAEFMPLELGSLASVRAFAEALKARGFDKLDLLVNNAGLACPADVATSDGFETQFQVNHLSHFLLTTLLFPLLQASPSSRIVNVSSHAHRIVRSMEFETLATGTNASFVRYGRSKVANLMFTFDLARRLEEAKITNVKALVAHPGLTYSDMGAKFVEGVFPQVMWGFWKWVLTVSPTQDTEMGALPSLYAATMDNVQSGDYYGPSGLLSCTGFPTKEIPHASSQSPEDCRKLWELSERFAGTRFELF